MHRVHVVVEVPRFGLVKRERGEDGELHVDYVSPVPCPFNYGCLPGEVAPDGDPPDAIVLGRRIAAGDEVDVPVRGVVRFVDDGKPDDKLVCAEHVPTPGERRQIEAFFRVYAVARGLMNRARGRTGRTAFLGVEMDVTAGAGLVRVSSHTNLAEAHLVRETLTAAGLHPRVRGELRPSYVGEIPIPDARIEVLVPAVEAPEARALLGDLDAEAARPDWTCAACGEESPANFAECWKCHAPRAR